MKNNFILIFFFIIISGNLFFAQHRHSDELKKEERIGITGMINYMYKDWQRSSVKSHGEFQFDSFRLWAKTDITDHFFASTQYRFYDGWQTIHHLFVGYTFKGSVLKVGQTWVPFGIDWQTFDDWGNITYYVGLQDDYDYGFTWSPKYGNLSLDFGFFKNQQLSSNSSQRYDADIYSGNVGSGDIILKKKENIETNQLNFRADYLLPFSSVEWSIGTAILYGQLYNSSVNQLGSRLAYEIHSEFSYKILHLNLQGTFYDYQQKLPDGSTIDDYNFINVSSWNFAYEIPSKANIISSSAAIDIIGDKLTAHVNYSYLWGGTSDASSYIFTTGLRTFWNSFDAFLEVYYGKNDPQLSGNTSGYGRNGNTYDTRIDLRLFYKLDILSVSSIAK